LFSWFHGDLSSQEAEEILQGNEDGTFLFRFSAKSGFLAVSYISKTEGKLVAVESFFVFFFFFPSLFVFFFFFLTQTKLVSQTWIAGNASSRISIRKPARHLPYPFRCGEQLVTHAEESSY
jgi:hypothetical protein